MGMDRRKFLKITAATTVGAASASLTADIVTKKSMSVSSAYKPIEDHVGCLVDTTLCIGCRKCEEACNRRNQLPRPETSFSDKTVFRKERRPTQDAYTVVNEFSGKPANDLPRKQNTYVKLQCMHCLDPACVSACIVGALTKSDDGSVIYDPDICMGCRYCMVACPFEIPAYEFFDPVAPRVRKCEFCTDKSKGTGANPSCAAACPTEAILFGKRQDLLALSRERIASRPERYMNNIYGENEVGGTGWLYLLGRPKEEIGLLNLPENAPPRLTEAIQHGIFRYGAIPIAVYGLLGGVFMLNHRKNGMDEGRTDTSGPRVENSKEEGEE